MKHVEANKKTHQTTSGEDSASKPASLTSKSRKITKRPKITREKVLFSILVVAWTFLATMGGQLIVAIPMSVILGSALQQPVWMLVYYLLSYAITLALVILVPPRLLKLYRMRHAESAAPAATKLEKDLAVSADDMGMQHAPTFIDIGLAPVGYAAYAIIATVLTSLMSAFAWFNANESQDVGFSYFITDLDRIWAMLAIVFIAPIAEELIMRGWLYGKLRRKWGIIVAMLITSLSFAVLHGQWNVGVSVFVLSIVLCTLREITGTIWSGVLLHVLSNGIAFYILYIAM